MSAGAVSQLLVAAIAAWPSAAPRRTLEPARYLPGTIHHLERARESMEAGQHSLAVAHSQIVLHDQGLRVYVDFSDAPGSVRESGRKAVEQAISYWNATLEQDVLRLTENPYAAQVQVVFSREVALQGVQVGGYCSQSRDVSVNASGEAISAYAATILARFQMPNGRRLNDDCLLNIVTHEFGHVFGLSDCIEPGHLMSGLNLSKPRFDLHADELEALKQLRLTTFDIQRAIQARVLAR